MDSDFSSQDNWGSLYSLCFGKNGVLMLSVLEFCPKMCWHGQPDLITSKSIIVEKLLGACHGIVCEVNEDLFPKGHCSF